MVQLAKGEHVWDASPASAGNKAAVPKPQRTVKPERTVKEKKLAMKAEYIEPMKARMADQPPPGEWLYEIIVRRLSLRGLQGGRHRASAIPHES